VFIKVLNKIIAYGPFIAEERRRLHRTLPE
jgi:hypothetical protein